MKERFYICRHCGNLIGMLHNAGVPLICCGQKMELLEPNTAEAGSEKHLPVVRLDGNTITVEVGSTEHPMTEEHSICWVYVELENGGMRKTLKPGEKPVVRFCLDEDKPIAVYAYCNLHGLWKTAL